MCSATFLFNDQTTNDKLGIEDLKSTGIGLILLIFYPSIVIDSPWIQRLFIDAVVLLGARRHVIIIKRGWSFTVFHMEVYSLL